VQSGNSATGLGLRLTLVATLGGLLFGYDTAVISGAVQSIDLDFIAPLGLSETWRDTLSGLTISSALFGCVLGSAVAGTLADRFGRRPALMLAAILFVISAIGSAWPEAGLSPFGTTGPAALVALGFYRLLCGAGIGIASMVSPLYIAEIAPKERRGQLVTLNQMAIVSGIVGVYFVNWLIARNGDDAWVNRIGWRLMLGSEGIPALIFLVLLRFVPDTPRWLVLKGRDGEALALLKRLSGAALAGETLAEIRASLVEKSAGLLAYGWPVIILGLGLAIFQQTVGINAVLYYAPLMFSNLGAGNDSALLQTVIVGGANMLATLVALFTVDRLGRKPLLIIGSVLMTLPMLALGLLFQVRSQGVLALICVVIYIIGFAISWGPVVWVVLAEVFPAEIRGKALALAVAVEWIANLVVSWSFKILDGNTALNLMFNHGFAYYLYGGMSLLSGLFVWRFLPETKGRSLDKMRELWTPRGPEVSGLPAPQRSIAG
jgi:MFS transporter, SP family, xylose:H+ symportor